MTWEEIKLALTTIYSQYIGNGKIIDDTDNGSTPSALAILVNLVNNRISSYPYEFNSLKETYTLTLTGATTYDLKTLVPGLKTIFQIYGINEHQEHEYLDNSQSNITDGDGWTIRGNTLIFTGSAPTGTATIQYKSKYLVKNTSGVRQQYFLANTDYSCLDSDDVNVLIFGVGQFINWKSDSESQDRRKEVMDWYKEAINNMVLNNKVTRQITSLL